MEPIILAKRPPSELRLYEFIKLSAKISTGAILAVEKLSMESGYSVTYNSKISKIIEKRGIILLVESKNWQARQGKGRKR